jgi:hypothetical protein
MIDFVSLAQSLEGVETPRLTFRAALPVDGWSLFEATRHELFNRFLSWSQPTDPYQTVARMEAIAQAHLRGDLCALSAIHRETGQWVALFRFLPYRQDPNVVEISLWIHSDFHRASLGMEITRTLVDRAFQVTGMPLMLAASCQENRPAQKVLLKCGFTYHSTVPRPHEDGQPLDLFEYRQTHEEWLRSLGERDTAPASVGHVRAPSKDDGAGANHGRFREVSGK